VGFFIYSQSHAASVFPIAWYVTSLTILISGFVFPAVGALVAFRQPGNRIGWLILLAGATVSYWTVADSYSGRALELGPEGPPLGEWAAWTVTWIEGLVFAWLAIFALLFPTGKLPAAGWRFLWILPIGVLLYFVADGLEPGPLPDGYLSGVMNPAGIDVLDPYTPTLRLVGRALLLGSVVTATASLILRLKRSKADERQQMQWICVAYVFVSVSFIFSVLQPAGATGDYLPIIIFAVALIALMFAIIISLLKYRLYEEFLINRAFVFGTLSAIVAGLYLGTVQLSRLLFQHASGIPDGAGIVVGTVIFGAAFLPLKDRVQAIVDKYYGPAPSRER
jgi:hypothetical protein